ncbi:protein arginine N-methyltransferase 5 [Cladophialophora yegresii CBS 114405]|uniref:Protein arginine N-methyltransferase 5 n=1 Tax=Cladophialophora yegresii CBS 114405 TaxID=1182544 RepID=W9WAK0_9EURO|nr:protein arginine N-methyltransferase 5 [Cladophialophora yegresii CBS 114405]EXJ55589.1 protein arginine N-methyltransferase 5 [Cladophialophora yegresii CBS 114405]
MGDSPRFIIGHHDSKRPIPVTAATIQDAHAANYDMVTSPITTPHFHSRVLTLLSSSLSSHAGGDITKNRNASPVVVTPLNPADTPLTPDESISQIIGITSSWIDLGSPDPIIADVSRQVLQLELAYAAFCGVVYALIPGPRLRGHGACDSGMAQYARALVDALAQGPYMQLYIWFPMIDNSTEQEEQMGDLAPFARPQYLDQAEAESNRLDLFGTWEAWDMIRTICNYPSRLCVALSVPKLLPPVPIQSRWYSEPVRLITLDKHVFTANAKGYPVLTRSHQAFIWRFTRLRTAPWFLLCDIGPCASSITNGSVVDPSTASKAFPTLAQAAESPGLKDPTPHLSYMRNLQTKQPIQTALDRFGAGYQDYLQAPLQPLSVNLESITYEAFEKDPIKYAWYERAIARALHDWIEQAKPTSNPDGRVVVAVVGAGRGPLVTRALKASENVGVEIDMWVLEKNPNAFVLLQQHNETTWEGRVNLVKSDMRTWRGPIRSATKSAPNRIYNTVPEEDADNEWPRPDFSATQQSPTGPATLDIIDPLATAPETTTPIPYKIDILISELLGSFGDNELSPECLDGVQHLLNPVHGISIPASYTAHITPIATPKLYADIIHGMSPSNPSATETPYVVMLDAIDYLSTATMDTDGQVANSQPPHSQASSPISPSGTAGTPYSKAHTRSSQTASPAPAQSPQPPTPTPIIHQTWAFHHPNSTLPSLTPSTVGPSVTTEPSLCNAHNARVCTLTFPIPNRGTCHGLAGYFETVLYRGVELSTNPNTMDHKSEGMISWFPIYYPLKSPLYLPDDSELQLTMWRKTDDRKVWYEWLLDAYAYLPTSPVPAPSLSRAPTQKAGTEDSGKRKERAAPPISVEPPKAGQASAAAVRKGKKIRIGGSELHSSEKEACLM